MKSRELSGNSHLSPGHNKAMGSDDSEKPGWHDKRMDYNE